MDTVTKTDIVSQLMQFAIDGDLSGITAHILAQRRSILRRHLRVWNDETAIEKELQNSDAGTRHSAVSGRVRRVSRRTLWKGLRQKVAGVGCEGTLYRL